MTKQAKAPILLDENCRQGATSKIQNKRTRTEDYAAVQVNCVVLAHSRYRLSDNTRKKLSLLEERTSLLAMQRLLAKAWQRLNSRRVPVILVIGAAFWPVYSSQAVVSTAVSLG